MGEPESSTREDASVCFLPKQSVYEALANKGPLGLELVRHLAVLCERTGARFAGVVEKLVIARVAELLLELHEMNGVASERRLMVRLELKRDELATMIGTTTETFVRELKKLEKAGVIAIQRRSVHILDVEALRDMASVPERENPP